MNVHRLGRTHAQLIARDSNDAGRILEHADFDFQLPAFGDELAKRLLLLAKSNGHLDTLGMDRHVGGGDDRDAQDDEGDKADVEALLAAARLDHRFGLAGCGGPDGNLPRRLHVGSLSTARNLAERARGLRARSSSLAVTTCLVSRRTLAGSAVSRPARARKRRLTMR